MKLRLRHNSIRLRLTQGEVLGLHESGRVAELIAFGPDEKQHFSYVVVSNADAARVSATCEPGMFVVTVPRNLVKQWAESEELTITAHQPAGKTDPLQITIEKDLSCLHPTNPRDNEDTFPNPAHRT